MADDNMEYSDDDYDDYGADEDISEAGAETEAAQRAKQLARFPYKCLTLEQVDKMLNESIELLSDSVAVTPSLAKVMLHTFQWDAQELIKRYKENSQEVLIQCKVKPVTKNNISLNELGGSSKRSSGSCNVCTVSNQADYRALACGHSFCNVCWAMYFEVQIKQGISTSIECMALNCEVRAPENFVLALVLKPEHRERYQQFCFRDYVKSHPELRYCPGRNCQVVIHGKGEGGGPVKCESCKSDWCFHCSNAPHDPVDCALIKKWLTKCADDSETANYISANTKDCPMCQISIEKNGGCNHMQCSGCRHDFCWMCLGEWRSHGSEYYECSKYRENPTVEKDSQHMQAREALKKYLHYYERWENHARSLRLEEQTLQNLKNIVDKRVKSGAGTWIDWQPFFEGANLLARCRYTLQYTYPYAYYMEPGNQKDLFEYQQAQLEAEIENLSWIIERAEEETDKGELQAQMHKSETLRETLLNKFQTPNNNN